MLVAAHNRTRATLLAEHCEVARTFRARVQGLLGRSGLAPGEGLWIHGCDSIHMLGMRFAIDVVFLDRRQRVVRACAEVKPLRFRFCLRRAATCLELPVGVIATSRTEVGDQIEFLPAPANDNLPA